ncbi:MAG: type I secretion system permease/ATPase [Stappia sp.]|uniref:type I secretion system permease/ATPase n=1 Tax=Stappia sp. TaxID=1870903 RepID=UPI000C670852|nr:type I secretion system permease/ATPase [Stappia sp.]MAB00839.1 type I secretion system permease/ATPase [Stappia sp.]MBM18960.1 type I secretion system permease/ATPase [Stappia sp.]
MLVAPQRTPSQPLAAAVVASLRRSALSIALISGVVNLLALTAPLFMLQVYDRVLASRSIPTLIGLAVLAAGLYAFQSLLDVLRSRVLLRLGERADRQLSNRVHEAIIRLPLRHRVPGDGLQPLRDLDNLRGFLSGQGPTAFFDLPWMPVYLGICFLFHVWIGVTALVGALVLVAFTIATNAMSRAPIREVMTSGMSRNALMEASRRNAESVWAMGMAGRLAARWQQANNDYLAANRRAGDVAGGLGGVSKSFRMMLQSAILGVGAWLVIRQEVSAGVMIASSIMMGRALAPVDLAIGSWRPFLMATQSWGRLKALLQQMPSDADIMPLPAPVRELKAEGVTVVPPGARKPTISGVNFTVGAGSGLGIVGPSGSGKSSLARALVGAWDVAGGKVRIDGASLSHWDAEALGGHIGYLPQGIDLFDGTIAENIARFVPDADPAAIVAAAKAAGAHEMILRLEAGYETRVGEAGASLSAGQRQRIGLARALFGDPFLVVLDEPNANLDAEGEAAVLAAIEGVRARGGIAVVIVHRPGALQAVDLVLMMDGGRARAFGPRDEVLAKVARPGGPGPGGKPATAASGGFRTTGRQMVPLRVLPGSKAADDKDEALDASAGEDAGEEKESDDGQ